MSKIGAQMRDNPLPLLLISAGVGLMMSRSFRNDGYHGGFSMHRDDASGDLMRRTADPTAGFGSDMDEYRTRARSTARGVASSVRDRVSSVGDRASSLADNVSSQASSLVDKVSSQASSMADTVSSQASSLVDTMRDTYSSSVDRMSDMTDRATDYTRNARSGLSTLATEQPLVLGALGLLAGAALAAMLPRTQLEEEYVGSAAQQLRDQATSMATDTYERAKNAASKAAEVASQEFSGAMDDAQSSDTKSSDNKSSDTKSSDAKGQDHKSDSKASSGGPSQSGVSSPGGTSTAGAAALGVSSSGAGGARPSETIAAGSSQQGAKTKA